MIKRICKQCSKEYRTHPSHKLKFCSQLCYGKNKKGCKSSSAGFLGKKHTKEWKKQISERMRGHKVTKKTRKKIGLSNSVSLLGHTPSNKGKKRPEITGKNHWNWKDGISPVNQKIRGSLEYKLWVRSVYERDNIHCQNKCGENAKRRLTAHHILNFASHPELRFAIDNGITLCRTCHKEFHRKYGQKNNNREQLSEFLNKKY